MVDPRVTDEPLWGRSVARPVAAGLVWVGYRRTLVGSKQVDHPIGEHPTGYRRTLVGSKLDLENDELAMLSLQTNPCGVEAADERGLRAGVAGYRRTLVGSKRPRARRDGDRRGRYRRTLVGSKLLPDDVEDADARVLQTNPCGVEATRTV